MLADVLECAGAIVVYLGTNVPPGALAAATGRFAPDAVGLSLTMALGTGRLEASIAAVGAARPEAQVLVGGQGVAQRLVDAGVPYVAGIEDAVAELAWLTGGVAGAAEPPGTQSAASPPA
jgi:methanogenic corrinoid protein MtbC1